MIEFRTVKGPLDDEQIGWIASLYGPVDGKYGSLEYVRHQFVGNPFGWSADCFAIDDGRPVGHCGIVPFRARTGSRELVAGKIETFVVAESHRGVQGASGQRVSVEMLMAAYAFALANGVDVLFGLAPPPVARVHERAGCRLVPMDAPAYVLVSGPRALARRAGSLRRAAAATGLSIAQNAVLTTVYAAARLATGPWRRPQVGDLAPADGELAEVRADDERWTISGADAWEWYSGSGVLRAIEIPGRFGSRAIVRVGRAGEASVQIVAWRPRRSGLLPGLLLLGAARGIARRNSAPTLRFQPWEGSGGDGALARTCRLLGFVRRPEADLLVKSDDPALAEGRVRLTPFFYVTF